MRLYYELYGDPAASDATPLLILHGGFMSGGAMADFAHAFRTERPVILLDQRAHGRSTGLDGPVTYSQMGDDAAAAVAALGLERADVLGYSMGAGAALQMAIRHPDRVGKLVVLSGTYRRDGWYLPRVHVVVRVHARAAAQDLRRARGEDLVRVHVRRRAAARLETKHAAHPPGRAASASARAVLPYRTRIRHHRDPGGP